MVLPALIFIAAALATYGVTMLVTPTRLEKRVRSLTVVEEEATPRWREKMSDVVGPFANLSTPSGEWDLSPLRLKFFQAGLRSDEARLIYFGCKSILPLFFAGGAFVALRFAGGYALLQTSFYLILAAMVGCYVPNIYLFLRIRRRKREILDNFADTADLMLVCVEAGMGLDAALSKVANEMRITSVVMAEELHLTNLEVRAGGSREKSLRNLTLRTGVEEIGTFSAMLIQADKFGTSVGDSLRVFSEDLRGKRQIRAEETAAKIPTKMLFPLVLCVFPSILMVILGPAIIQIIRTLLPSIAGTN